MKPADAVLMAEAKEAIAAPVAPVPRYADASCQEWWGIIARAVWSRDLAEIERLLWGEMSRAEYATSEQRAALVRARWLLSGWRGLVGTCQVGGVGNGRG